MLDDGVWDMPIDKICLDQDGRSTVYFKKKKLSVCVYKKLIILSILVVSQPGLAGRYRPDVNLPFWEGAV